MNRIRPKSGIKMITSVHRNLAVRERVDPQHLMIAQISAMRSIRLHRVAIIYPLSKIVF
jgi:hypothetical protein